MILSNAAKKRRADAHRAERTAKITKLATPCDPVCVECGALATKLVGWSAIYRPRPDRPDLMAKKFWRCECGAYVGCHAGTEIALGKPAGPATQQARRAAHAAFDPLWEAKIKRDGCKRHEARGKGYRWLAEQLGIAPEECHIGWMDAATARRVAELCASVSRSAAA